MIPDDQANNALRIGIDIGKSKIAAGVIGHRGLFQAFTEVATDTSDEGEHIISQVEKIIGNLIASCVLPVQSIGIATFGMVSPTGGIILGGKYLPAYRDINVVDLFSNRFGVPTYVENDVLAAALGEFTHGIGVGSASMTLLSLGTNIGVATVIDGHLLRGAQGRAGQIAHLPAPWSQNVTIGDSLGGAGIANDASHILGYRQSAKEALYLASRGDVRMHKLVQRWATQLGALIAWIVCTLDPGLIVLNGGIMQCDIDLVKLIKESVHFELSRHWPLLSTSMPCISCSQLLNRAAILGATSLA